ncbi:hypothetical protein FCULG_00012757 [Fusarium culmorum]|uniref:Uncharacterized protein n=1 Tax=Fusarium culmorum TaxID=5516 RepID=A0A2T4GCP1_FUSCU|nr:hypothetical protein FCULG_00012757 [Fusarium culmorum]
MIDTVDHIRTTTPVVKLQVWHLDRRGQNWFITPSLAFVTRDHYVPIENLTDEIRIRFTHFHLFFSLELDFNLAIEDSMSVDRNGLIETLRVAVCALDTHASLVNNGFVVITAPEQLANHYANEERNSDNDMDEIKLFWQQSLSSPQTFQSLAGQIQTCISKIIDDRTAVSKEELHLALIHTNLAAVAFADHQRNVMKVLQKMRGRYNEDIKSSRYLVGFAFLVIATVGATMTGGLSTPWLLAAAASGCGGLGVGVGIDQGLKWCKVYSKELIVRRFDKTIDELVDALRDAKLGLASIYCSDILHMPLRFMGARERVELLKSLGIDMKELKHENFYNQELIELRIGRFNKAYAKFDNEREAAKQDTKLKELIEPRPNSTN